MPLRNATSLAVVVATVLLWQAPAAAHRIVLFAEADGSVIRGEAYFPGGGPARDVEVRVAGPGGGALGVVRTDAEGQFTFTARHRCDHTFVVDSGDGHRAECLVEAGELAANLPALPGGAPVEPPPPATAPATQPAAPALGFAIPADLERIVRQAVRKELDRQRETVRLQEVVAGVGYIFGIMGLWALLKRRHRTKEHDGL